MVSSSAESRHAPSQASTSLRTIGDYTIVGPLAAGGMAELFLARRVGPEGFARSVVVKQILPHLAKSEEFVTMFLDEARIAAGIRHPNVVSVEALNHDGDSLYMVMEYLAGESVHSIMRELGHRERLLPPHLAGHIVAQACAGLHAAHELTDDQGRPLGVVHRDVSPHNLFVTYDGTIKVLDFGIAKAADRLTRTETGQLKGKLAYISPEQFRDEPLDRRADIFSLGIVLFELCTGRRLFKQDSPAATLRAVIDRHIIAPSVVRPGLPESLDEVCLRALARTKQERYRSAEDMRRALRGVPSPSAQLPEEDLRALMHELFRERAAEKAEMLRRVSSGESVDHLVVEPSPETGSSAMPAIGSEFSSVIERPRATPSSSGRFTLLALLAVAAVAGSAMAGLFIWSMEDGGPPSAATAPANTIEVRISSDPPGATVTGPGGLEGTTPLSLQVERAEEPVSFRVQLAGHRSWTETLVPDANQRLRVRLDPVGEGAADTLARAAGQAVTDDEPIPEDQAAARLPDGDRRAGTDDSADDTSADDTSADDTSADDTSADDSADDDSADDTSADDTSAVVAEASAVSDDGAAVTEDAAGETAGSRDSRARPRTRRRARRRTARTAPADDPFHIWQ